ncbi:MAG: 50S ribosomal protein L3 N(5)-glutamine methyltransferase [Gammaproteobacteria bacterium]|nr:50S ribosomal protein L3 N(5)-glutamine methyltransferase [Gammaproteobacteria bacterium]
MNASGDTDALLSIKDFVRWGASEFARCGLVFGHGTDNPLDESLQLVLHALHLRHDLPPAYADARLTGSERTAVLDLLDRRIETRQPAPYLIGEALFCGLPFFVDERVLIPRSPIAELIEAGFEPWISVPPARVLDLCTGSACIAIAAAFALPQAQVDAADIDAGALKVARSNIRRHGMDGRVRAVKSDLFDKLGRRRYDLIVSNPPYVPTAEWQALAREYQHEPRLALDAGDDGMELVERILTDSPRHLSEGGTLICEIGGSRAEFEARFVDLPAYWPEFERGGDGVFVIGREELADWLERR